MTRTIWKYPLEHIESTVQIPKGGTILTVHAQAGVPCLWILVDAMASLETRKFKLVTTGEDIQLMNYNGEEKYIGTVFLTGNALVYHIFEIINR